MGVMMLAAGKGATVTIETDGPDEAEATPRRGLIADRFGEWLTRTECRSEQTDSSERGRDRS